PKNAVLRIAKAAHDQSISASAVVVSATSTESRSADTTSASLMVTLIHVSVRPSIGQASIFDELNAKRKMMAIGIKRNSKTSATHSRSAIRLHRSVTSGQSASNAPRRLAPIRYSAMIAIGTMAKAAAKGTLLAIPMLL